METTEKKPTFEELRKQYQAEVEAKAEELSKRENTKVYPFLFMKEDNTPVMGYIKEPNRFAKIRLLDKGEQIGNYTAAAEMLELCLLPESDPRIKSDLPENDHIFFGACLECQKIIRIAVNQIKKN